MHRPVELAAAFVLQLVIVPSHCSISVRFFFFHSSLKWQLLACVAGIYFSHDLCPHERSDYHFKAFWPGPSWNLCFFVFSLTVQWRGHCSTNQVVHFSAPSVNGAGFPSPPPRPWRWIDASRAVALPGIGFVLQRMAKSYLKQLSFS